MNDILQFIYITGYIIFFPVFYFYDLASHFEKMPLELFRFWDFGTFTCSSSGAEAGSGKFWISLIVFAVIITLRRKSRKPIEHVVTYLLVWVALVLLAGTWAFFKIGGNCMPSSRLQQSSPSPQLQQASVNKTASLELNLLLSEIPNVSEIQSPEVYLNQDKLYTFSYPYDYSLKALNEGHLVFLNKFIPTPNRPSEQDVAVSVDFELEDLQGKTIEKYLDDNIAQNIKLSGMKVFEPKTVITLNGQQGFGYRYGTTGSGTVLLFPLNHRSKYALVITIFDSTNPSYHREVEQILKSVKVL